VFTESALELLSSLKDKSATKQIVKKAEKLSKEPDKQGKPLQYDLLGYRSVRVAPRHRIVYSINYEDCLVTVHAAGLRKDGSKDDAYELAKKLLDRGEL